MAPKAILPNPENCSLDELEKAMLCTPKQTAFIRMQAIRTLLLGFTHDQVADIFQKSRRTISQWVRHFNESGIDGLIDKPRSGRPRKTSPYPPEQSAKYQDLIENPQKAGQEHWTAKKFHGYIREELGHELGYRTVTRWLHRSGYRLKVPQPWPDRQNEAEREAFVRLLREWLADPNIDIWYLDETGIEADPRPRRRWIQQGEKGRVTKNGDHIRMNVTGMICPRTGEFYALEFTHPDSEAF
jgi:transposase